MTTTNAIDYIVHSVDIGQQDTYPDTFEHRLDMRGAKQTRLCIRLRERLRIRDF